MDDAPTDAKDDIRPLILMPAYNEERTIGEVVGRTLKYAGRLLVVDDGSTDRTGELAAAAGAEVLRLDPNVGKAAAMRKGFEKAAQWGFDWVLTIDADGQHDPAEIPRMIELARTTGADVVVGHRLTDGKSFPLMRGIGNRFSTGVLSLLAGTRLPDTQSGYRLLRRSLWEAVPLRNERFAAEPEFMVLAARQGAKIEAHNIRAIYNEKKSHFRPLVDSARFLRLVMQLLVTVIFKRK